MSFSNAAFDCKRGAIPDMPGLEYQSYMDEKGLAWYTGVAASIASRMMDSEGRFYRTLPISHLVPSSGSSVDYAYATHLVDPSKNKIYGFGFEFGTQNLNHTCVTYPTVELHNSTREVRVGLMEFLLEAAKLQ